MKESRKKKNVARRRKDEERRGDGEGETGGGSTPFKTQPYARVHGNCSQFRFCPETEGPWPETRDLSGIFTMS